MAKQDFISFKGLNFDFSPLNHQDGDLLECQNFDFTPDGAVEKRYGYTGIGAPGTITDIFGVKKIFSQPSSILYAVDGTSGIFSSDYGTSAWGTLGSQSDVTTIYPGVDNFGGTIFLATGTATGLKYINSNDLATVSGAPQSDGAYLVASANQGRLFHARGNYLTWSSAGDATNWNTSGTSDSDSVFIGGPGQINWAGEMGSDIVVTKNKGVIAHWDGYRLYTNPSKEVPISDRMVAEHNGLRIWRSKNGMQAFDGSSVQNISRKVKSAFFEPAAQSSQMSVYSESCFVNVGTITTPTGGTLTNVMMKYDIPYDRWSWYQTSDNVTALHTYIDEYNFENLYMGGYGNVFRLGKYDFNNTGIDYMADNSAPITSYLMGFLTFGYPDRIKKLNKLTLYSSLGCPAKFQIAFSNTLKMDDLNWIDCGDLSDGVKRVKITPKMQGRFMFYKLYERSDSEHFYFYGFTPDVSLIGD